MSDYTYDAIVRDVHDGDSITVDVDCGFDLWVHGMKLRLHGLNAPELSTPEGKSAKLYLTGLLPIGSPVLIETIKDRTEKYGRMLAKVQAGTVDVNYLLISTGHAKPYLGKGPKE